MYYPELIDDYKYIIEHNMEITDDFLDEEIMIEDGVHLDGFKADIEELRNIYFRKEKLNKLKNILQSK